MASELAPIGANASATFTAAARCALRASFMILADSSAPVPRMADSAMCRLFSEPFGATDTESEPSGDTSVTPACSRFSWNAAVLAFTSAIVVSNLASHSSGVGCAVVTLTSIETLRRSG
jgi:hypothetical protein